MKKLFAFLSLCYAGAAWAQAPQQRPACAADSYQAELLQKYPEYVAIQAAFQEEVARQTAGDSYNKTAGDWGGGTDFTIPVVVHVIHDGAPISMEQVISEFDVLFSDYRRKPGTRSVGGGVDMHIEFSLVTKDPNGAPHPGVEFINNAAWARLDRATEDEPMKTATAWDNTKYLNVWLVKEIQADGQLTVLGYAQFPAMPAATDGVVIRSDCWGTEGTAGGPVGTNKYGRTCVHECGHWLNLYHPFEGGCGTTSYCPQRNDRVCDTPPTTVANFEQFNARQNTCHIDNPDRGDNPRIYMDYLNDDGMNTFTLGQRTRAHNALNNASIVRRFNVWQDENLQAVGAGPYKAPTADFYPNNPKLCAGGVVTFYDYSKGTPNSYLWTFPGGNPTTSTEAAPKVTYAAPGTYAATLKVQNESGISDEITKQNIVTVSDIVRELPFEEGFDNTLFPPTGWVVENPDPIPSWTRTWKRTLGGGFSQSLASAQMNCYNYKDFNQKDALVSPRIDCHRLGKAQLEFSVAYAPYNDAADVPIDYTDTLSVYASLDGGDTWNLLYKKGGKALSAAGASVPAELTAPPPGPFWKRETIKTDSLVPTPLNALLQQASVRLKFEVSNGYGNNLYIDDIKLFGDTITVGVSEPITPAPVVFIAPNPLQNDGSLSLHLYKNADLSAEIFDATGRKVGALRQENLSPGSHALPLNVPHLASGVYTLRGTLGSENFYRKFVVVK